MHKGRRAVWKCVDGFFRGYFQGQLKEVDLSDVTYAF